LVRGSNIRYCGLPACPGKEKLPLQVGHLDQLCPVAPLHARVFERHEERRHERAFRVTQVVEQIERLARVFVSLTRQADDKVQNGNQL